MLTQKQLLKKFRKGLCAIESEGYTFVIVDEDTCMYCASGVFPGNLRGGAIPTDEFLENHEWTELNLKGLILSHGFYPDPFMMSIMARLQFKWREFDLNLQELVDASVLSGDCRMLKHPTRSPEYWYKWFNPTPEDLGLETDEEGNLE